MAATPKPVRKAAKKFISAIKKTDLNPQEIEKEKKLAKSKYQVSSAKHKKSVAADFHKMTKEVKRGRLK